MDNQDKEKQLAEEDAVEQENGTADEHMLVESTKDKEEHHHSHHHSHHSHHDRHHHRHHRHRKHTKKRSRKNFKKFWIKNKKVLIPIAICFMVLIVLSAIVLAVDLIVGAGSKQGQNPIQGADGTVILSATVFQGEVSVSNSAVKLLVEDEDVSKPTHVLLKDYDLTESRLDVCQPVQISFNVVNQPAEYEVEKYIVTVEQTDHAEAAWEFSLPENQTQIDIFNLKTDTEYRYTVNVHFTNGAVSAIGGIFRTEAGPRILTVGGLRNVRDIGGWKTADGRKIQQGILYRGTEMDGQNDKFNLTEEGKEVLLNILRVKTDLDLRWSKEVPKAMEPLGENVRYIRIGMPQYTDVFLEENKENVRAVFSELANPSNYPMYLHCIYGRDRTGTICGLLMGVLGVSEEDIYREYRLTGLHTSHLDSAFSGFMGQLKQWEGQTLQQKTENYLLSIGVTAEEIASIQKIFLE